MQNHVFSMHKAFRSTTEELPELICLTIKQLPRSNSEFPATQQKTPNNKGALAQK